MTCAFPLAAFEEGVKSGGGGGGGILPPLRVVCFHFNKKFPFVRVADLPAMMAEGEDLGVELVHLKREVWMRPFLYSSLEKRKTPTGRKWPGTLGLALLRQIAF